MSHTYLIDLYELIEQRLQAIKSDIEETGSAGEEVEYLRGRSASLVDFREFLKSGYDVKLPRRLRGKV